MMSSGVLRMTPVRTCPTRGLAPFSLPRLTQFVALTGYHLILIPVKRGLKAETKTASAFRRGRSIMHALCAIVDHILSICLARSSAEAKGRK